MHQTGELTDEGGLTNISPLSGFSATSTLSGETQIELRYLGRAPGRRGNEASASDFLELTDCSVDSLVTSYEKDPPFVGAIMESGQSTFFAVNANASAPWDKMVSLLNCSAVSDVLACVRAIPATTIQTLIEKQDIVFRPVFDTLLTFPTRELRDSKATSLLFPSSLGLTQTRAASSA